MPIININPLLRPKKKKMHIIDQHRIPADTGIPLIFGHTSNWTSSITLASDVNDITIDWGDGSAIEAIPQNTATTHNYTTGTYNATIYTTSTQLTRVQLGSSYLKSIDFSSIAINTNAFFIINLNPTLDTCIFGNYANTMVGSVYFGNCNFSIIDLSYVTVTSNYFQTASNPNLTSILWKNAANTLTGIVYIYLCNFSTLDFSYVTITVNDFRAYSNPSMSQVLFKNAANTVNGFFLFYNCAIANGLNPNYISFLSSAYVRIENNAMTAAAINRDLVVIESGAVTSASGVLLAAGTNSAPDGTSGGYDGLTAKAALLAKLWSVTTN